MLLSSQKKSEMPGKPTYPPEFKQQIGELVRAGRSPESFAREYDPAAPTIRNWGS